MANTLCFPEGIGGVHKTCGNSGRIVGGGEGCAHKNGNSREEGDLGEIPTVVGYGYFLELHIELFCLQIN